MRIGIVSRAVLPGGMVVWAGGLYRGLRRLGHEVSLVYVRDSRFFPMFESELNGLRVERVFRGPLARVSEAIGWPLSLAFLGGGYGKDGTPDPLSWILAPFVGRWRERFDLLVFAEDFTGIAGLALKRLSGTPYIVFVHEASGGEPSALTHRVIEGFRRTVRREADLTCAIDEAIATGLRRTGEPHVATVPLGCDPIAGPLLDRAGFVVADSRWTPARDPEFILEVAKLTPGVQYLMLGSFWTPETESIFLERRHRDSLENQVTMKLNITSREATMLYQRGMVYIRWAASGSGGWEMGFPTGIRIAMSNSCPVIYDRNLGCAPFLQAEIPSSAVDHAPDAFATQIRALSQNPDLVRARATESLRFAQKFQWSYSASMMLEALARVSSPPTAPPVPET